MSEAQPNSSSEVIAVLPPQIQRFVNSGLAAVERLDLNDCLSFATSDKDTTLEFEGYYDKVLFSSGLRRLNEIPRQPLIPVEYESYSDDIKHVEHYHGLYVYAEGKVVYHYSVTVWGCGVYEAKKLEFEPGAGIPDELLGLAEQIADLLEAADMDQAIF